MAHIQFESILTGRPTKSFLMIMMVFIFLGLAPEGYAQPSSVSETMYDRMFQTYQDKKYSETLNLIEQIVRRNPNHPQLPIIQTIQANAYFQLGKYPEAYLILNRFIQIYPDHPNLANAYYLLGSIENIQFHYYPAAEHYLKAFSLSQSDPNLRSRIDQNLQELIGEKLEIQELIQLDSAELAIPIRPAIEYTIAENLSQNFDYSLGETYWEKLSVTQPDYRTQEVHDQLILCRNCLASRKRIGMIAPMSGEYSGYGTALLNGVSMAIEPYNRQNTAPVRILVYDNRNEPIHTVLLTKKMIQQDSVIAVIGPIRSMNAIVAGIVAAEYQIPLVAPVIMIDDFNQLGPNLFQLSTPPAIQGELIASYAIKQLGLKYFVILAPNSTYGHSISQNFIQMIKRLSAQLIDTIWYEPSLKDFNPLIEKLRNFILKSPQYQHLIQPFTTIKGENKQVIRIDGVFIPAEKAEDIITILPQLNYSLISGRYIGNSSWLDDQLFHLSSQLLDSVIIASDERLNGTDSNAIYFKELYQKKYHQPPDLVSQRGYDAASLILKAASAWLVPTPNITGALQQIENFEGVSGRINLKKKSGVNSHLYFYEIKNRQFMELP